MSFLAIMLLAASLGGARPQVSECFESSGGSPDPGFVTSVPARPSLQLAGAIHNTAAEAANIPELAPGALMLTHPGVHLTGTAGQVACVLSRKRGTGFIPTDKSPRPPKLFFTLTLGPCSG